MESVHAPPQEQACGGVTIAVYLALFLVVLAFFILLVTISSVEQVKSNAVMDSLTSTFASALPPSTDLTPLAAKEGDVIAGQVFQEEVTGIFATLLRVAKIQIVQPGRLMRVLIPADSLFHVGEARIREARYELLDRIVAAVSARPPGLRFDVEFMIGTAAEPAEPIPETQTLEAARAGSFAREMHGRGAPLDSLAIALKPGDADSVVIRFYVRTVEETRLRFRLLEEQAAEGLAPEAAPAPAAGGPQ